MSNSFTNKQHSVWRPFGILSKKRMFPSGVTLGLFTGNKGGHSEHILNSGIRL